MSNPIEFNGHSYTIAGWARKTGLRYGTLIKRFENGWTVERALTTPLSPRNVKRVPPPVASPSVVLPAFDLMKRADRAQQRELTRMLRQFSRDFAVIMERTMHRGVVADLPKKPSDRSLSVAQERT
ncbi:hypothetical protein FNL55_12245 [Tardiphaga sp. vice352]|uniref:hypothetical protein n=1 Tax=unclassified Tardiphaga TaxID=2631404 RepID=UPI00116575A8|nr:MULTISPECIES: hypothetical protein [unclassified Tardiphaga]QDM16736.1 hypothetical protein FNL53_12955 [Tardiphaga sp. vice278]QDM32011.1 hypothetical protein FNL55_12245 [Tardiphaga sp. vice352]